MSLVGIRISGFFYRNYIKGIYFKRDAEKMHKSAINLGKFLGSNKLTKRLVNLAFNYQDKRLEQKILGIKFRNPVGLSAGFDKNAELIDIMQDVGFGFVEVGSVTAKRCMGNKGKRLWRIPEKKSLRVNFGLNNNGALEISKALRRRKFKIPFGVNIAKTNCKETVNVNKGIEDYIESLRIFEDIGDYFTINISCPNAYGGRPFSSPGLYERLLREIDRLSIKKPVFVKLSPDLSRKELDAILRISGRHEVDGFICTNLSKKKGQIGGFSGKFVEKEADKMLSYVYKKTKGKFVLIGVGGIFSAEDAYRKIKLGANLVELITGMVYNGPGLIGEINAGLVELLEKDSYRNIGEAVGNYSVNIN